MYSKNDFELLLNEGTKTQLLSAVQVLEKEIKDKATHVLLHSSSIPCILFHFDEFDNYKELSRLMNNIKEFTEEFNNINQQLKALLVRIDDSLNNPGT